MINIDKYCNEMADAYNDCFVSYIDADTHKRVYIDSKTFAKKRWAKSGCFAPYFSDCANIPDDMYIDNDKIRTECITSLCTSAQTRAYERLNHINNEFNHDQQIIGIGTDITDKAAFKGTYVIIDIYTDIRGKPEGIYYNNKLFFQGSEDEVRIALGKIIGADAADALFLSLAL